MSDEHEVQHHVGRARRHREEQAQLGLFRGNKEALEQVLQHERRLECQQNAAIQQTAGQQLGRCAQQQRHGPQQCQADDAENRADAHSRNGQHTEQPVCALLIAHAQRHGDQRTAARADHKAEAAQHLEIGVNEVQRRERRFARAVRDKEAVHNRVDRREDHQAGPVDLPNHHRSLIRFHRFYCLHLLMCNIPSGLQSVHFQQYR